MLMLMLMMMMTMTMTMMMMMMTMMIMKYKWNRGRQQQKWGNELQQLLDLGNNSVELKRGLMKNRKFFHREVLREAHA